MDKFNEISPYLLGACMLILGFILYTVPEKKVRNKDRNNQDSIEKEKKKGKICLGVGTFMIVFKLIITYLL